LLFNVGIKTLPGRGNTISQRLAYDRKLESKFQKAMSSASMLKSYLLTLSLVDLGKIKHLLDLGGGDGTIALWLQKKYPKMKISIFELPSVCRMARKNIKKHGLSHKISVIPGNFFEDSFPEDVDAMLFCKTLPNFSPETNQKLIKKCYDSLPKGGMLIISDPCCNEEQTGPLTAALYASYYLTLSTGEGMIYTVGEYIKWLRDAGFSKVRNYANSFEGHCVIVGVKQ
jgi:cyclopropane fatty-acyl-phospholipid synthase-like methyltransferase